MEVEMKSSLYRRFATLGRDEAGTLIIIAALLFPVLLAFMGLSLDVGLIYDWKRREQSAADAAAIGAATEIWRGGDTAAAKLAGKNDSALNHFDEGSTKRDITVDINIPYNGSNIMVEAVITERKVPTYFMRVLGWEDITVQSRAVAGLVKYSTGCLHALNPDKRASLVVQGTAVLDSGCEIMVNSNHTRAITVNGGGCLLGSYIGTSGDYAMNGSANCIDPPPLTEVPTAYDSMSYMQAMEPSIPAEGPTADKTDVNITGGEVTLTPGYYYGTSFDEVVIDPVTLEQTIVTKYNPAIRISGGIVHFEAGLYILDSGMTFNGDAYVDVVDSAGVVTMAAGGPGVTFYSTNSEPANIDRWGRFFVAGTATVILYAPAEGDYEGILLWEDDAAPGKPPGHVFAGSADSVFNGAIYTPSSALAWRGTNDTVDWTIIVADTIEVSGGAVLPGANLNNSPIAPPVFAPTLLE